ncbi:serine protease [Nonomuraea sp. WAC 01424]|uniref:S8 family peptidase n=1 Tax=Nonomuraea sp. WAC 01424 TaxID=2203200 RepID=UPI000F7A1D62|nr:S8 family serine peptidase [Nonomuraea sp. WAC 01424]RSN15531.1 serine protease [Nonomuraea sp. WAC 01424]
MPSFSRLLRRGSAVAVTAVTLAGSLSAVSTAGALAVPAAQPDLDRLPAGTHKITLITGDTVTLSDRGGAHEVDVDPAARPGGPAPAFLTRATPKGVYVFPTDAMAAVNAGNVDKELFNVEYLAENGYTDAETKQLPVIVQYPRGQRGAKAAADALPATTTATDLTSISGAGLQVDKAEAGDFWSAVRAGGTAARTLKQGVAKLWLDRKVQVNLAESVPLIGAPQAWAAGFDGTGVKVAVLDTGVDTKHPDLAGVLAETHSFVPGQDVTDGHGHGTHVASTIAGSGSASDGKNKGVAPGAKLLIGKVLDNAGRGESSWLIDGMEWAASSGAKVVSMSIGGGVSDGSDPMSQAVDELTASTGTLFVIAAGNNGPGARTVNTPGTAEAALTVAATTKTDELAGFSSRGPRLDGALKPDIAAPGFGIVAARAAGTAMGTPVDDYYTSANGTSMATPHVAGAVAILAQRHPDWTAAQYKAALMSTSKQVGLTVYEEGAGRVDVARAASQQVVATTANLDFGDGKTATKQVTYANLTDQPVTLTLTPTLSDSKRKPIEGALSADKTLAVPAGGTATATVTLDAADLGFGAYGGAITAQAGDVRLSTPVGLFIAGPRVTLTVKTIGRDGAPLTPTGLDVISVTDSDEQPDGAAVPEPGVVTIRVPPSTYSVMELASWIDDDSRTNYAWLSDPEVNVAEDTTITLDLRKAGQVRFGTPTPAGPLNNMVVETYQRTTENGAQYAGMLDHSPWDLVWALPTKRVTKGTFRFAQQTTLGQSEVSMSLLGKGMPDIQAVPGMHWEYEGVESQNGHPGWVPFTGTQDLPVVNVGTGTPEELAGLDLKGKLALLETGLQVTIFGTACGVPIEVVQNLRAAGAAGVVAFPSAPSEAMPRCSLPLPISQTPFTGELKELGIANVSLSARDGAAVRDRLAKGPVTIRVTGTLDTPFTYALKEYQEGRIPESLNHTYKRNQLAQVDVVHVAPDPATKFSDHRLAWKQDERLFTAQAVELGTWSAVGPHTRRDYVGPLAADVMQLNISVARPSDNTVEVSDVLDIYDKPVRTQQRMFAGPRTPGGYTAPDKVYRVPDPARPYPATLGLNTPCDLCRRGDLLFPIFHTMRVNGGLQQHDDMGGIYSYTYRLTKQDGTDVPLTNINRVPLFRLPPEKATYRLSATSKKINAVWTFTSFRAEKDTVKPGHICAVVSTEPCRPEPMVTVGFDLDDTLDLRNTVATGRHRFTVNAGHGPSLEAMPKIAGLKVWASTDDGKTWNPVQLSKKKGGSYTATATYPSRDKTTGTVSLKAEAWDTDGNRVEQTTLKAFGLR